jgi:trigger factor
VRLGLLLSEIGAANGVEITDDEMRGLIGQAAQQYQGEDRQRFIQAVQQNPMFAAQIRAPLYEDKVVDFLFSKSEITDRTATRAQLEADLESEEGHVHGPGCGHDHAASSKPKKAGAKKPAAKAAAPKPEAPAKGPVEKASAKPKPAKPLKDGPGKKAPEAKAEGAKSPAKKGPSKKAPKKG